MQKLLLLAILLSSFVAQAGPMQAEDSVFACLRKYRNSDTFVVLVLDREVEAISTWALGREQTTRFDQQIKDIQTSRREVVVTAKKPRTTFTFNLDRNMARADGRMDPDDVDYYPECTSFETYNASDLAAWSRRTTRAWNHHQE